jgi:DNA-directed RNA polymerase beta subunit
MNVSNLCPQGEEGVVEEVCHIQSQDEGLLLLQKMVRVVVVVEEGQKRN